MGYFETILVIAGLNVILALSVFTTLAVGQFSLAQVGFWAIGAYLSAILTTMFGWPLGLALAASALTCCVISLGVGYPCLRIRGMYLAMATLGFSESVRVLLLNLDWQILVDGVKVGPNGVLGFRGIAVQTQTWHVFLFVAVLLAGFAYLGRTRLGQAMAAIREDEVAAQSAGVDIVRVKVLAFMAGAAIAGVGGGLYANYMSYLIAHDFGFHLTLVAILFVALGGVEVFWGPVLGAVLLTVIPEYIRFLQDYRMIFYGLAVMVVIVLRPKGLLEAGTLASIARWLRPGRADERPR